MDASPLTVPPGPSESDLIRDVATGSAAAITEMYHRYAAGIFRVASRLLGSASDAEDVVQDVFVGLPEAIRKFDGRGRFEGWLRRVAARTTLMRMRRERQRRQVALERNADGVPVPGADDIARWDLERALRAVPAPLRAVLVLRQLEGYTHREIGTMLGISSGASRVRFSRALQMLRRIWRTTA